MIRTNAAKRFKSRHRRTPGGAGPNRTYESNGPNVKLRGTASYIAERYQNLANDAMAAGDLVGAENHLQHAEHYLRLSSGFDPMREDADGEFNAAPERDRMGGGGAQHDDYASMRRYRGGSTLESRTPRDAGDKDDNESASGGYAPQRKGGFSRLPGTRPAGAEGAGGRKLSPVAQNWRPRQKRNGAADPEAAE